MERICYFLWFAEGRLWCGERKIVKGRMRREITRGTTAKGFLAGAGGVPLRSVGCRSEKRSLILLL